MTVTINDSQRKYVELAVPDSANENLMMIQHTDGHVPTHRLETPRASIYKQCQKTKIHGIPCRVFALGFCSPVVTGHGGFFTECGP